MGVCETTVAITLIIVIGLIVLAYIGSNMGD